MAKRVKWEGSDDLKRMLRPIESLRLDPDNVRTHPDRNIDAIAKSLATFRQVKNIVVHEFEGSDHHTVIAGNGTLRAALELGWTHIAAVHFVGTDEQARAFAIADNRTTDLSAFDSKALAAELATLSNSLDDLSVTGFTEADLELLIEENGEDQSSIGDGQDPDNVPEELPERPVTETGDVWILGKHRLLCGDSTDQDTVRDFVDAGSIDLVITDPPYNVGYIGKTADSLTIKNDKMAEARFRQFLLAAFQQMRNALKQGGAFYIFSPAGPHGTVFRNVLGEVMQLRQVLIWCKDQFVLGRSDYHYRHEDILFGHRQEDVIYGWRDGEPYYFKADRTLDSVWECERPKASRIHPTMKPVKLLAKAIRNSSTRRQTVFDPFCGSGSTMIACEMMARACRTIELDPAYCDAAVQRWQTLTEKEARLESTGATFAETAEARGDGS